MTKESKIGARRHGAMPYRIACAALTAALCGAFFAVFALNGFSEVFAGSSYSDHFKHYIDADQYAYLADALLHGRLWLDLPVPDALAQLPDPYDYQARRAAAADGANPIFWDHAFFEGRYYCYFGVVPALLLYVPFQLVTGQWLNTSAAVCILGLGFVVCACLLIFRLARLFFRGQPPFGAVALATCMFVGGSNIAYLEFVSRFYSVPIIASLLVTCLGLWFWLGAKDPAVRLWRGRCGAAEGLSGWRLAAGSLLMALNIGCRPQFILACLLAFPIFWDEIVRQRTLLSSSPWRLTLAALAPFAVVFALQGWYNAARFGSPLTFGSQYNLTGFDMTSYEQKPITTLVVLFWYLLQPLHLEGYFPFVFRTSFLWPLDGAAANPLLALWMLPVLALVAYAVALWVHAMRRERRRPWLERRATLAGCGLSLVLAAIIASYLAEVIAAGDLPQALIRAIGIATVEPMFGGYFWLCPMALLIFTIPQVKPILRAHGMYGACVLMLALAAVVLIFDARMVGANQRYFSDFAWYVMLTAVLCLFAWVRRGRRRARRVIALATVAVALSAVVGAASLFSQERYEPIAELNPGLYDAVAQWFPEAPEGQGEPSGDDAIGRILKPSS